MDTRKLQAAVGAPVDGVAGVGTFTALFRKCGAAPDRAATWIALGLFRG